MTFWYFALHQWKPYLSENDSNRNYWKIWTGDNFFRGFTDGMKMRTSAQYNLFHWYMCIGSPSYVGIFYFLSVKVTTLIPSRTESFDGRYHQTAGNECQCRVKVSLLIVTVTGLNGVLSVKKRIAINSKMINGTATYFKWMKVQSGTASGAWKNFKKLWRSIFSTWLQMSFQW